MIRMPVIVKLKSGKEQEFLQAMDSLFDDNDKAITLCQEIDDRKGFLLMFAWETREECERYIGEEKFRVLLGALKVLCEQAEIWHSCIPLNPLYQNEPIHEFGPAIISSLVNYIHPKNGGTE